jgi:hypothetical protein
MKKMGFWEGAIKDIGWGERKALNEAAESIRHQDGEIEGHSQQLKKLLALDTAQANEIDNLRAIIEVLSDMLVDMKVLDGDVLATRIKDKLAELEAAKRPAPKTAKGGSPYRGGGEKPARRITTCTGCQQEFKASGSRTMCSSCHYASSD